VAFNPQTALEYLRTAQRRNRLAHAYLIAGAGGSGKRQLAAEVAHLVNGAPADQVFTGAAPAVHLAGPESKSRRIVIEQIRNLEHALQMRASDGRRKVAIISDADRMLPQAANAFLKTLEEPPNNSLLLLLSAMPEALPDTILSRCLEIPLRAPNETSRSPGQKQLIELLKGIAPEMRDRVQEAYRLVQGFQALLGQIRDRIQEEADAAQKAEEVRYKNTTDGEWLESREAYYKALTESRYLEERAQLIEILFLWWADVLRARARVAARDLPEAQHQTEAMATRLTTPEILRRIRRLEELRDHLGRNVQETLALEVAFLNVFAA
jgi:DNA polymerase-3 subunit delta'